MRIIRQRWGLALLFVAALISTSGTLRAASAPAVRLNGEVEKINLDGVVFRESTKDAFGKPVEREVTKRLYASAGEQQ